MIETIRCFIFLILLLTQAACSTFLEAVDPNDSVGGYRATQDEQGYTKYVRKRVVTPKPPPFVLEVEGHRPESKPAESLASSASDIDGHLGVFLSRSSKAGVTHLGLSLDIQTHENLTLSGGLSVFASDKLYLGFDGIVRVHMNRKITPFVGLGLYLGDSKRCQTYYQGGLPIEECEKYFLTSLYPELGVSFDLDGVKVLVFARDYSNIDQNVRDKATTIYGMGLQF